MVWQGRKDSNPRPSVLETDALTRLSYAPLARPKVYRLAFGWSAPTAAWQRELVATSTRAAEAARGTAS